MQLQEIQKFYSKSEVQNAMLSIAKNREIVGTFSDGSYTKRPDTLQYAKDITERVKKGVVAFHCSVERWANPMQLTTGVDLAPLRTGWDLIIDLDTKTKFEHSRIAANTICEFLMESGVKPTIKFSGRRGFHIGVASEAFPEKVDYKLLSKQYPEAPQAITAFIREKVKDRLFDELVYYEGGIVALTKQVEGLKELTPYAFVEVEKGWGN